MPTRHRNSPRKPETLTATEQTELRQLLLAVTGALDARPEPKDFWDGLARRDADARHPRWLSQFAEKCREALDAGRGEGVGSLMATVHRVRVACAGLEALILRPYLDDARELPIGETLLALTREVADVTVASAEVLHQDSEGNLERVRYEAMEIATQCERVIDVTSAQLARTRTGPSRPAPLSFAGR